MKDKLEAKDYGLMVCSVAILLVTVISVIFEWSVLTILGISAFGCILMYLLYRQLNRPEPSVTECEEYLELNKEYMKYKKVAEVKINLLTSKVEEKDREMQKYKKFYEENGEQ